MFVTRCCNKVISAFSFNWWPVIKHNHFHGSKFTIGYYGKFIQTSPLTELQTWSKITLASMHVRYKLLIKRFYFDTYPTFNIAASWKHSLTLGSVGNWDKICQCNHLLGWNQTWHECFRMTLTKGLYFNANPLPNRTQWKILAQIFF